jgi:predicted nucleic acid-binding protein
MQLKATIDSSVVLALGKLGYLKLACQVFDKLIVPQSVLEEIKNDQVCTEVNNLIEAGLIEVTKGSKDELSNMLSSSLGKGETETIVLALELATDAALLDDLRARKTANRLKVRVMGTLGMLKVLIDLKLINEKPEDLCEKLMDQGFWVDAKSCLKVLKG